jgi:hypothetical protein
LQRILPGIMGDGGESPADLRDDRAGMRAQPEATVFSVSQNDNRKYCECDRCAALAQREGTQMAQVLHLAAGGEAQRVPDVGPPTSRFAGRRHVVRTGAVHMASQTAREHGPVHHRAREVDVAIGVGRWRLTAGSIDLDGMWQVAEGAMESAPPQFEHTVPVPA